MRKFNKYSEIYDILTVIKSHTGQAKREVISDITPHKPLTYDTNHTPNTIHEDLTAILTCYNAEYPDLMF